MTVCGRGRTIRLRAGGWCRLAFGVAALLMPVTTAVAQSPSPAICGPADGSAPASEASPSAPDVSLASTPSLTPRPSGYQPEVLPPSPPIGSPWRLTLTGSGQPPCSLDEVVAWHGGFVAGSYEVKRTGAVRDRRLVAVWESPDGIDWRPQEPLVPGGEASGTVVGPIVAYRDGLLLFGTHHGRLLVWRSVDAERWNPVEPSLELRSGGHDLDYHVAVRGRRVVVLGATLVGCEAFRCPDKAVTWTSLDGRHWHRSVPRGATGAETTPPLLARVDVGPNGFITLGRARTILGSRDGVIWRRVGSVPDDTDVAWSAMAHRSTDQFTYLAASPSSGNGGPAIILRSKDLRSWTEVYRSPYTDWYPATFAVEASGIVLAGWDEGAFIWMLASSDGVAWDLSAGWSGMEHGQDVSGAAVGIDRFVVVALGQQGGDLAWTRPVTAGP